MRKVLVETHMLKTVALYLEQLAREMPNAQVARECEEHATWLRESYTLRSDKSALDLCNALLAELKSKRK